VFVRPEVGSVSTQWQAAMIVPSSEITKTMCTEELREQEFLIRLFEDYTFGIKDEKVFYKL
jgi:hypothetical protein